MTAKFNLRMLEWEVWIVHELFKIIVSPQSSSHELALCKKSGAAPFVVRPDGKNMSHMIELETQIIWTLESENTNSTSSPEQNQNDDPKP